VQAPATGQTRSLNGLAASGTGLGLCGMCQVFGVSAPQTPPWRIMHNLGVKLKELRLKSKSKKFTTKTPNHSATNAARQQKPSTQFYKLANYIKIRLTNFLKIRHQMTNSRPKNLNLTVITIKKCSQWLNTPRAAQM
jgi:hypothetical protein